MKDAVGLFIGAGNLPALRLNALTIFLKFYPLHPINSIDPDVCGGDRWVPGNSLKSGQPVKTFPVQ